MDLFRSINHLSINSFVKRLEIGVNYIRLIIRYGIHIKLIRAECSLCKLIIRVSIHCKLIIAGGS